MTIHRLLNQGGLGGNYTTWYLWNLMVTAGYTVLGSGSGTGGVWSVNNDVFQHSTNPMIGANVAAIGVGIGSEDWGNGLCWIALKAPDGSHIVIQRDAAFGNSFDDEWCYYYSPGGLLNFGAAAPAVAPTAADGHDLWGTINVAHPQIHGTGNVANLIHLAIDDSLSVAGFSGLCCLEFVTINALRSVVMVDDLASVPSGGLFAPHAKAFQLKTGATGLDYGTLFGVGSAPEMLVDYGGGSQSWDNVPYTICSDSGGWLYPGSGGAPSSGEVPIPIIVGGRTHGGFAGLSRWLRWQAVTRPYNDRSTAEDLWYVGDVEVQDLPDGVTIPGTI